jgi:hypothetical protein
VEKKAMNPWNLILASSVAAALLTGCTFPSSSTPGALANNALPRAVTAHHSTSSQQTLIYTKGGNSKSGVIFTYPGGSQQTYEIYPPTYPAGLCSDSKGDVFLVGTGGEVEDYAFGATSPTAAVLTGQRITDAGCAVDDTTGNLAMAVTTKKYTNVAVLSKFTPPAKVYTFGGQPWSLTYDNKGNLFVLPELFGKYLGELKKGANTFTKIPFSSELSFSDPSFVQWDGKYIAITAVHSGRRQGFSHWIYRCNIANSEVQLVSIVKPLSFIDPRGANRVHSWIAQDRNIFISSSPASGISVWAYPNAGKKLAHFQGSFDGATVAAPDSQ